MSKRSTLTDHATRRLVLAASLCLWLGGSVHARAATPFGQLAGQWSGNGTIEFSDNRREPLKCRAAYDVLGQMNKLQFNIRCASQSYNFDLRGSVTYNNGAVSGSWSESTRNAAGSMNGTARDGRFQVLATGPTFSANLTLATRGGRQTVTIRSPDPQAHVRGATINLRRK
jgi:hypothetical protein